MNSDRISNKWKILKALVPLTGGLMGLIITLLTVNLGIAAGPVLTRHPFIARQTTTSTVIIWQTDVAATSQVDYGPSLSYGSTRTNTTPATTHVFTLTSLLTNTRYYYRAIAGGVTLASGSTHYFETEKSPTFTFVALGDSGTGTTIQKTLANRIREISPNLVVHTGDLFYKNWSCSSSLHYQCSFFDVYSQTLKNAPFYVTPGDHDYEDLTKNEYMNTFSYLYTSTLLSHAYYAVEYGNALFVTINVDFNNPEDYAIGSPMYNWLQEQLSSSTKFWKFVYFDKPLYGSSQRRGVDGGNKDLRAILAPLLERYNVDMVFHGDYHIYERSLPINEYYPGNRGVIYVVTGGGGGSIDETTYDEGQDWWTAYSERLYHIVRVDVNDCRLTLKAIDSNGAVFDTYELNRCPGG